MPTVRVAQISDTHLGGTYEKSMRPEDALEATVRALVPMRPDVVLLTGDITDGGQADSYRDVATLLQPLQVPTLAVAGNHDDPDTMRSYFGAESELVVDAWRIVTVDTHLPGEIHGAVDVDAVLRRLGPDTGRPTLLAMHHPAITPSSNPWFQLTDGAELVAALGRRSDVRIVLGGHLHDVYRMVCGEITYLGAPSTWYSLDHVGDSWRPDDGPTGALRIDLFPDGRFEVDVVRRALPGPDVTTQLVRPAGRRAEDAAQRLFDRYVTLHWTAASKATRGDDTLWRATLDARGGELEIMNHPTRAHAVDAIVELLLGSPTDRVFIGIDAPLGFPEGLAGRLAQGSIANWRAVWAAITDEVVDQPTNENNRFLAADRLNVRAGTSPGPFWGAPLDFVSASLPVSRPSTFFGLMEQRLVERRLAARGVQVGTAWQMVGKGSTASEALLAIPALRRLADHPAVGRRVRVWPFDTGCDSQPSRGGAGTVVIAQVLPELFEIDVDAHSLREVALVSGVSTHMADLDRNGTLGELFAPALTPDEMRTVEREEGWILGA